MTGPLSKVTPSKNKPYPGFRVGKLQVVARVHDKRTTTANLKIQVRVQCDCGNRLTIPFWYMVRPHSPPKSDCGQCGPKSLRTLHPDLHSVWYMMNYRTSITTSPHWKDYGGRGIRTCERWSWDREDNLGFANFVTDTFPRKPTYSLDRRDNNGHYQPSNCRWTTMVVQRSNQGRTPVAPLIEDQPPFLHIPTEG